MDTRPGSNSHIVAVRALLIEGGVRGVDHPAMTQQIRFFIRWQQRQRLDWKAQVPVPQQWYYFLNGLMK